MLFLNVPIISRSIKHNVMRQHVEIYQTSVMEAFIGTTFVSSALKDVYISLKNSLIHDHATLNKLLNMTDVLSKIQIAEEFTKLHEDSADPVFKTCCQQVNSAVLDISSTIECINEKIMEYNTRRIRLFGPRIEIDLITLENLIRIFNSRLNMLLKLKTP